MSITAALRGSLTITDNLVGSVSLSKVIDLSYTGELSTYGQNISVGTTTYTVNLPISPTQFVYVKNLSSVAGNTVTVTWTPTGGASASIVILDPSAAIVFSEVNTSNGISALSLVASAVGTPVEFVVAG